eukprot:1555186-Prymnesium_polylepis.1
MQGREASSGRTIASIRQWGLAAPAAHQSSAFCCPDSAILCCFQPTLPCFWIECALSGCSSVSKNENCRTPFATSSTKSTRPPTRPSASIASTLRREEAGRVREGGEEAGGGRGPKAAPRRPHGRRRLPRKAARLYGVCPATKKYPGPRRQVSLDDGARPSDSASGVLCAAVRRTAHRSRFFETLCRCRALGSS